jgi:hypothetical protein
MRRLLRILVLVLVGTTAGCSGRPPGAEYFWLSPGARITYDMKILAPLTGVIQGTAIFREDGTTTIAGQTYHKSVVTFDGVPGAESETSYERLGKDGIYSRKSVDASGEEVLEIPLPPDVGRNWSYGRDDLKLDNTIAAIEDVDTPEATYRKCLKVVGTGTKGGTSVRTLSYYAPQVGLIKQSMVLGNGVSIELKRREK